MSSRKYNTNDNDLIWESFQKRTNHELNKQNGKYSELLENDLKYIEEFLIREGIWDKVKGAAGAAAGKVKDFAADKIMKPLMDMLAAAIQKDPASAEKLPELQQAAQGGGDIGAILQASGDQSIMKQIEGQPDAADPAAAAAPQAESYLYQFNMNSMICEALVDQGIISESKSQIIQERRKFEAASVLFESLKRNTQPKDCPWMPNLVIEKDVRGADGRFAAGNQSGVQYAPAEAPAEAPAATPAAGGGYTGSVRKDVSVLKSNIKQFLKANPKMATDGRFKSIEQMVSGLDREGRTAEAPAAGTPEAPAAGTPEAPAAGTPEAPAAETPTAETPTAEAPAAEAPADKPGGPVAPGKPTVGPGGASMPADSATPTGGTPAPADGAKAPGILGKVWNFVKANKGAIGGLAAMGIAAALIAGGGPLAIPATRYLTGALMGGVRGAIKGAKGTEGGMMDKFKGAANQAGADSMKGGAVGMVAGAAGDAVGSVMGGAANAAADGQIPSAAAEPYVEPSVEPEAGNTSDYGGEPEDYNAGGVYDQETPDVGGTSGGFDPETGESNMDMSDEEAAAFNAQDANGETPGVSYQEPTATSAADAEAGVGKIDPVTGKEIEAIDPENKPGFFKKLGSLLPGGTKPREVWGDYTGKG